MSTIHINDGTGWQPLGDVTDYNFHTPEVQREPIHLPPAVYKAKFHEPANVRAFLADLFRPTMLEMVRIYEDFKASMPPNRFKKFMYRAHQRERDKRYQRRAHRIYRRASCPTT